MIWVEISIVVKRKKKLMKLVQICVPYLEYKISFNKGLFEAIFNRY